MLIASYPTFVRSFKQAALLRVLFLSLVVGSLAGCASGYRPRDASGQHVPVPVASFKLERATVEWMSSPQLPVSIGVTVMGNPGREAMQKIAKSMEPAAQADMLAIQELFKNGLRGVLEPKLKERGVASGRDQVILVSPVSGRYTGAERVMSFKTVILDVSTKQQWSYQVSVTSGPLMSGPHNNPPTDQYVRDYVEAIISVLKDGGLIK